MIKSSVVGDQLKLQPLIPPRRSCLFFLVASPCAEAIQELPATYQPISLQKDTYHFEDSKGFSSCMLRNREKIKKAYHNMTIQMKLHGVLQMIPFSPWFLFCPTLVQPPWNCFFFKINSFHRWQDGCRYPASHPHNFKSSRRKAIGEYFICVYYEFYNKYKLKNLAN